MNILHDWDPIPRKTTYISDTAAVLLEALHAVKNKPAAESRVVLEFTIGDSKFSLPGDELESILRKAI